MRPERLSEGREQRAGLGQSPNPPRHSWSQQRSIFRAFTEPLPFYRTVEHDGARWTWTWTEASPRDVQSSTVGYWRRRTGRGGTAP